ncbi:MAG: thioredoxin fold domain-containing protein, partial [Burkholderiales bacterium]
AITTTSSTTAETAGTVEVHDLGEGVQSIRISTLSADGARNALTPALCAALSQAFAAVSARSGLRAVVLEGTDETFAQGGAEACEAMLSSGLVQAIAACPVPVLAACAGDAVDAGWWLASLGDQLVASEAGHYGYGPGTLGLQASQASLMRARHGAAFMGRAARQVPWSGRAWRASGCAFAVVPREQLSSQVAQWTQSLSDKPGEALRLLKAHLTQAQRAAAVPTWPLVGTGEALAAEPAVLSIDGHAVADVLRQFEEALESAQDKVTVYLFPYPLRDLHPNATEKSVRVWCAKDRAKAWRDALADRPLPEPTNAKDRERCQAKVDAALAIGRAWALRGTPALIRMDGKVLSGAMPVQDVLAWLNSQ